MDEVEVESAGSSGSCPPSLHSTAMSSYWNFFHDAPRNYNTPPEQPRPSPPLDANPHQPTLSTSQPPLALGSSVGADAGTDVVDFPAVGTVFDSLDHFKKAVYRAGGEDASHSTSLCTLY